MRLQVTLRQVRALAARHHAAHVEGAAMALLDALHWVGAAVQVEAGKHRQHTESVGGAPAHQSCFRVDRLLDWFTPGSQDCATQHR